MRIKNKDIAEKLGISTTAVSLALNNKPGVSDETRRKVLEIVNESASKAVQKLENGIDTSSRSILMSVHKKNGRVMNDKPFFQDIVESAQQELLKQSYNMILSHYVPGQDISQYISYIRSLPVSGLIIVATELDRADLEMYKTLDMPMVLMDASFDLEHIDSVALDNQEAMLRAVHYAYTMGHRDIGYLRSETRIENFVHSFDGYTKGLRTWHLTERNNPVIDLPCDIEGAYQKMSQFLDNTPSGFQMPTIFLAELDYIALGAMRAFREHGFRIPDDLSIIGYDDIATSSVSTPPLTTNRVNHTDIGRFSAFMLVDRIRNPRKCCTTMQISSDLIVRESVKDLRTQ